jgi:hypothetical protein
MGAPGSPKRTWVEHDLFPMLSPSVYTSLQEKKKEGLPPDFLWSWWSGDWAEATLSGSIRGRVCDSPQSLTAK